MLSSKSPTVVLHGMLTFFSNRVINIWNSLPSHIVQAPSVATFRKRLCDFNYFSVLLYLNSIIQHNTVMCVCFFLFGWALVSADFVCLGVPWR